MTDWGCLREHAVHLRQRGGHRRRDADPDERRYRQGTCWGGDVLPPPRSINCLIPSTHLHVPGAHMGCDASYGTCRCAGELN